MIRLLLTRGVAAAMCLLLTSGLLPSANAQQPSGEPVRLIVGFAPGGSNDIVARIVGAKVSELVGAPVLVVNQPGGNGAIATEAVARAKPDGRTLLLGSASTLSISPHTVPELRYDPQKDFAGIGVVAMAPQVIAVNPAVNVQNLSDFVALAKGTDLSVASAGTGGLGHLTIELLKMSLGLKLTHVPYKGGAPAATDAVAGHVQGIFMDLPPLQSFIDGKRLRAVAVTSKDRSAFLPNVPSITELVPDVSAVNWFAVMAPKGLPPALADRLHAAFSSAASDPVVAKKLRDAGMEPMTHGSRGEFDKFLASELERWGKVAERANVSVVKK